MKIYLIGMPGSGKSSVGKALAKKLQYHFIDLDAYIEQTNLMFIDDIFKDYGETKFRELESKALSEISQDNVVIATGGGIVTKKSNKDLMEGVIIYLNTDLDIIKERLEKSYQRPLLLNVSLEDLYQNRFIKYQGFANYNVSNNSNIDMTITQIIKIIEVL